jgi:hypothetical protein
VYACSAGRSGSILFPISAIGASSALLAARIFVQGVEDGGAALQPFVVIRIREIEHPHQACDLLYHRHEWTP